jgi:excisionase family DNA binding protein
MSEIKLLTRLLTVNEVAERLQVSNARVYELLREEILPGVALGRQRRVNPVALEEFIKAGGAKLPGGWKRA